MDAIISTALALGFFGWLAFALERTHRRGTGRPRRPLGADREHDRDLARVVEELRAASAVAPTQGRVRTVGRLDDPVLGRRGEGPIARMP